MSGSDRASTAGYAEAAPALTRQYESVTFEEVHRDMLPLFPERPSRVLDIGAGTGRDAAALALRGHAVTAVEPTQELREHGQSLHAAAGIRWVDDGLPDLAEVEADRGGFDLILLTAVWMHLDEPERARGMRRVAELLAPGGLVVLSLRHGPVPAGRRMFDVSGDETQALAARNGLAAVGRVERDDALGRDDVRWTFLALKAPG
ncbi:class I SAM-dependent methyltransferase [Salinarimonas soli]|uniref:Class I SAM-dependent methyltransferase n=1 Tax=Salinarimonas soli TaxID=1638099 RepID=A0A5B2VCK1_9HYPH|nr:class I SAM-dependent methyltransferase [Salinarimonas soli]KAA2236714.1 class I SAM-dependent methyltransferase [Salinarimonas soli]